MLFSRFAFDRITSVIEFLVKFIYFVAFSDRIYEL